MELNANKARNFTAAAVAALGIFMFAPHAQACGKKPGEGAPLLTNMFASLQEAPPVQPLFAEAESAVPENQNGGRSRIVGMWIVTFYVGNTTEFWDFAIEQFHSDGNEMTNDINPPALGNVCWGVWEPSGRKTIRLKHAGLIFDANGVYAGLFDFSANLTLDDHGDTFSGTYASDQEDLSGNIIPSLHAEGVLKAKRFKFDSQKH